MAKLTFRREPKQTGLSGVGNPYASVQIKRNKREVGLIAAPNWQTKDGKWGVGLMVKDEESSSFGWKWVFFKARHDNEDAARAWVTENAERIQSKYDLHEQKTDDL